MTKYYVSDRQETLCCRSCRVRTIGVSGIEKTLLQDLSAALERQTKEDFAADPVLR